MGGRVSLRDHLRQPAHPLSLLPNRHCPKCQHIPRERWLDKRKQEILPVPYFHVVFTLPHELNCVILNHKRSAQLPVRRRLPTLLKCQK